MKIKDWDGFQWSMVCTITFVVLFGSALLISGIVQSVSVYRCDATCPSGMRGTVSASLRCHCIPVIDRVDVGFVKSESSIQ